MESRDERRAGSIEMIFNKTIVSKVKIVYSKLNMFCF